METSSYKTTASLIHLSTLTQYMVPFGNFIVPVIIWSSAKDKSEYVDVQGRRAINFQLSITLYSLVLIMIAAPILLMTIFSHVSISAFDGEDLITHINAGHITGIVGIAIMCAFLLGTLKIAEFFLVIYAAVKASHGEDFKYPLTIPFLKSGPSNTQMPIVE